VVKDVRMCSRVGDVVVKDVRMCSRMCACVHGLVMLCSRMCACVHGLVMSLLIEGTYNCSQGATSNTKGCVLE
jgi:hypothetical protein